MGALLVARWWKCNLPSLTWLRRIKPWWWHSRSASYHDRHSTRGWILHSRLILTTNANATQVIKQPEQTQRLVSNTGKWLYIWGQLIWYHLWHSQIPELQCSWFSDCQMSWYADIILKFMNYVFSPCMYAHI